MDIETLLRDTLADQAHHAPRAGEDFIDRALAERSARRRRAVFATGAVAAVTGVVVAVTATTGLGGQTDTATPAPAVEPTPAQPTAGPFVPAPSPAEQQAELAAYLGIDNPPPVPVIDLVTPGQAQRLVDACMVEAGWGDAVTHERVTIDVATGEISTSSYDGGYRYTTEQQPAFELSNYICMASYPIDPAYTENDSRPYVRSGLIEAAGPGQSLGGYRFASSAAAQPDGDNPSQTDPTVAWVNDGDFLAITTWGSSTCPTVPVSWLTTNRTLSVETAELRADEGSCTTTRTPFTTIFEVPMGIDATLDLPVTIDGAATTLPALP